MGRNYVEKGVNDLASQRPDLAREWHPTRNLPVLPDQLGHKSSRRVWWQCARGHEWATAVCNRTTSSGGTNCPFCSGRRVTSGENDLKTTHPDLVGEWDFSKNSDLTPQFFSAGSEKQVWWICMSGHSWKAQIRARARGNGCPMCAGQVAVEGVNDLATTNPQLSKQWHPTKNGSTSPSNVMAGSGAKAWWQCDLGHEWQAEISGRNKGRGCPYCSNKKVLIGFNDLVTTHPDLAAEWDQTKTKKQPVEVTAGSHFVAAWRCAEGHAWFSKINDRLQGRGCPYCAPTKRWEKRLELMKDGSLSLLAQYPDLLSEWSPRNEGEPGDYFAKSGKKVWWVCPKGHEWETKIAIRANGSGCPSCAVPGFRPAESGGLYLLESQALRARKIGISNNPLKRIREYSTEWKLVDVIENGDGSLVRKVEAAVLIWLRVDNDLQQYLGNVEMGHAGGATETFSLLGPTNDEILTLARHLFSDATSS